MNATAPLTTTAPPGHGARADASAADPADADPTAYEHAPETCGNSAGSAQSPGVHASARIRAGHNGRTTTVPLLHSDGPFHLRRLRPRGDRARVSVIGAMSAPLGGDRLTLDVTAENHARLEVATAAATIALRGPTTAPATYDVRLTVGEHASLNWLPQPLISTRGSTLHQTCAVDLAPSARLLLREEQQLGRTAEPPGLLSTRLTVRCDGRPLLDQHTLYGEPANAWDGPAVLGPHRAAGQLLAVHPRLDPGLPPLLIEDDPTAGHAVLAPLADVPAFLITAIAPTSARLRRLLDTGLAHVLAATA
ncbi:MULTISPECIES: urease accessory protein UreD [unclassified Streptomyces]|uniref:urease accessory protein UreD n=1 Tax=unclassified Streptomyces TaxID=2593676 RepID=UPI000B28CA83|nr:MULTISPECIES: urease accessory protein UreD [unclassified Streptomyces]